SPQFPNALQTAAFPVYSDTFCDNFFGDMYQPASMLCAGHPDVSSCEGDSGGPLVALDGSELVEVGIVSWGPIDCGIAPGVYSRLSSLSAWVESVTGVGSPPPPRPTPDVTRLAGADRAASAVAAPARHYADGRAGAGGV